jgi:hypothetical protein
MNNVVSEFRLLEKQFETFNFFQIAATNREALKKKRQLINSNDLNIVLLDHFSLSEISHPCSRRTIKIPSISSDQLQCLAIDTTPSLVLLTNNMLAKIGYDNFRILKERTKHCVWIIHDYDCHHWYSSSFECILHADIYCPAHHKMAPFIRLMTSHDLQVVPSGSIQWESSYLRENKNLIFNTNRDLDITGRHTYYDTFHYRNQVIATISKHFPNVGFISDVNQYHFATPHERLLDWTKSCLHFIAPVSEDVPNRFFDALVTGGIPIVPNYIVPSLQSFGISRYWYETYGPYELLNPEAAVNCWLSKYKQLGQNMHFMRITQATEQFHIDSSLRKLVDLAIITLSEI